MREQAPGVILAAHADVLRVYCECVARYGAWSRLLAQSGPLIRGARGGELVRNPLAGMVRDQADQVRMLARELGLTPSALAGMGAADVRADPFDEFLRRAAP
jgi:P27 family predicted phage terminase small subunit